jgi:hypothetical protein
VSAGLGDPGLVIIKQGKGSFVRTRTPLIAVARRLRMNSTAGLRVSLPDRRRGGRRPGAALEGLIW